MVFNYPSKCSQRDFLMKHRCGLLNTAPYYFISRIFLNIHTIGNSLYLLRMATPNDHLALDFVVGARSFIYLLRFGQYLNARGQKQRVGLF